MPRSASPRMTNIRASFRISFDWWVTSTAKRPQSSPESQMPNANSVRFEVRRHMNESYLGQLLSPERAGTSLRRLPVDHCSVRHSFNLPTCRVGGRGGGASNANFPVAIKHFDSSDLPAPLSVSSIMVRPPTADPRRIALHPQARQYPSI